MLLYANRCPWAWSATFFCILKGFDWHYKGEGLYCHFRVFQRRKNPHRSKNGNFVEKAKKKHICNNSHVLKKWQIPKQKKLMNWLVISSGQLCSPPLGSPLILGESSRFEKWNDTQTISKGKTQKNNEKIRSNEWAMMGNLKNLPKSLYQKKYGMHVKRWTLALGLVCLISLWTPLTPGLAGLKVQKRPERGDVPFWKILLTLHKTLLLPSGFFAAFLAKGGNFRLFWTPFLTAKIPKQLGGHLGRDSLSYGSDTKLISKNCKKKQTYLLWK